MSKPFCELQASFWYLVKGLTQSPAYSLALKCQVKMFPLRAEILLKRQPFLCVVETRI